MWSRHLSPLHREEKKRGIGKEETARVIDDLAERAIERRILHRGAARRCMMGHSSRDRRRGFVDVGLRHIGLEAERKNDQGSEQPPRPAMFPCPCYGHGRHSLPNRQNLATFRVGDTGHLRQHGGRLGPDPETGFARSRRMINPEPEIGGLGKETQQFSHVPSRRSNISRSAISQACRDNRSRQRTRTLPFRQYSARAWASPAGVTRTMAQAEGCCGRGVCATRAIFSCRRSPARKRCRRKRPSRSCPALASSFPDCFSVLCSCDPFLL